MEELKKLEYSYDAVRDVMTIEGKKYSGGVFRAFALKKETGMRLNTPFELVEGPEEVVTINILT